MFFVSASGYATDFCLLSEDYLFAFICLCATLIAFYHTLHAADITWGNPMIPEGFWYQGLLVGLVCSSAWWVAAIFFIYDHPLADVCYGIAFCMTKMVEFYCRGPVLLPFLINPVKLIEVIWDSSDDVFDGVFFTRAWTIIAYILARSAAQRIKYLHDQRVFFSICYFVFAAARICSSGRARGYKSVILVIVAPCMTVLLARRRRSIPYALRNTKFISLAHIRMMHEVGHPIRRCQDIPEDAFGDISKVHRVIVISHRWLDHFSCDVRTNSHPNGFRLRGMVDRLNRFFPASWTWSLARLRRGCTHSGTDVAIFFDYMSLPQVCQNADGSLLARSQEEEALFREALPAIGSLYTMYPVMAITQVVPSTHSYLDSGWCFSEFQSALLMDKLSTYSQEVLDEFQTDCTLVKTFNTEAFDEESACDYMTVFESLLSEKQFFHEPDRDIVRDTIRGILIRRRLKDAICSQNVEKVRELLILHRKAGLDSTIDQAIDTNQNTLLHLAARLPSGKIIDALLDHGANAQAINMRGDTPFEWFALPRCYSRPHSLRSHSN
eukprot:TRINITY_DN58764_c0_g1_i1.p1 TRINITY_DN58764_c0_g1~~TRINITY_DN58764_c0_g1_i1.p1  ORF type:complete len:573 (+),score=33.12 TRINITY_DN58764_c0_g1_i1:65-1720(+)